MAWINQTADFLSDSLANPQTRIPLLAATGASFTLGLCLRSLFSRQEPPRLLPSPRTTLLPALSDSEKDALPLPLDVLPGARDVPTPYGSIRVYEWGPEDGPKVLFVHGITTPCVALGGIAHAMADKGCRVMLFDLFGRGYSDSPSDLPQDDRLFTTQILLALNSSPLSWTGAGSGRFCLVGYSLGGGIAAAFASYFPDLLSSLVLLAPAGLIRDSQISFQSRLMYSNGLAPENVLSFLVGRRLRAGPLITPKPKNEKVSAADAITEELPTQGQANVQLLSRAHPNVTVPAAVKWQVQNHIGFVGAFMSSMRHGPILKQRQLETWKRLGKILTAQKSLSPEEQQAKGLRNGKVLVLCGNHDSIIVREELVEDATAALEGNVEFRYFDAGHEFPSTKYDEVAQRILDFWG